MPISKNWTVEHNISLSYVFEGDEPVNETEMRESAISYMQGFLSTTRSLSGMRVELLGTEVTAK